METTPPPQIPTENPKEGDSTPQKEQGFLKHPKIATVFAIIEALSLISWIKSEDFNPDLAALFRKFAICGFISGAGYLGHEFAKGKCKNLIIASNWIFWAFVCVVLLCAKSPPSIDESGNLIGSLLPANDPIPSKMQCGLPADAPERIKKMIKEDEGITNITWLGLPQESTNDFFILMGGNYISLSSRHQIPVVRFQNEDFITLSIGPDGANISGQFFEKDQNVFAVLTNNMFTLDKQNYWKISHPDKSTLIIINHHNEEVLNIRYCNRNFFEISGIFYFPDNTKLICGKTFSDYGGMYTFGGFFYGICVVEVRKNLGLIWGSNLY